MDEKIKDRILKSPYFLTGVVIFVLLLAFSFYKSTRVGEEAESKNKALIHNFSSNNIDVIKDQIFRYKEQLEYVRHIAFSTNGNTLSELKLFETANFFMMQDTLIQSIEVLEKGTSGFSVKPVFTETKKQLVFILPTEDLPEQTNGHSLSLTIDLEDFHNKIAQSDGFSYAYLTISYNNKYLFHPDELKIGKDVELQNRFTDGTDTENSVFETYSDYLEIPVYRYFDTTIIAGEPWIFTANVPGISFKEIVIETRNSFVAISLLAAISFVVIFFMGVVHWQKEFVKRQKVQEEKIKLELKNENQKQQVMAKELEQLKSGLNPHFLFNSLSSLKILVSKKPEEAKSFAVALSNLYRYLLKQEKLDLVLFEEELDFAKSYIYLQQIRFPNINVEIDIPNEILKRSIPPMSLQLLVENCIKHTKISSKNPLEIEIFSDKNFLFVRNNYNPPEAKSSPGIGLENLTKRYLYLTDIPCEFHIEGDKYIAKIPLL